MLDTTNIKYDLLLGDFERHAKVIPECSETTSNTGSYRSSLSTKNKMRGRLNKNKTAPVHTSKEPGADKIVNKRNRFRSTKADLSLRVSETNDSTTTCGAKTSTTTLKNELRI